MGDFVFFGDPRMVARGLAERPPDLIFVLIDTLRADHVTCYGYGRETTPNLDRLAERAVRFTNARAQSSWTRPSVASIFTSLYPSQHRILRESATNVLSPEFTTLAELLQRAGYATASFSNAAIDLDLRLYRVLGGGGTGEQVAASSTTSDEERIAYVAAEAGTYYLRVFPFRQDDRPRGTYRLMID